MTAKLIDGNEPAQRISHKRAARVIHAHELAGIRLGRRVRTTTPEPADQKYLGLLQRDFTTQEPNQRHVGDITYLPLSGPETCTWPPRSTATAANRPAGLFADHMRTELIEDAPNAAVAERG